VTTTRAAQVIDGLLATLRAASGFRDPAVDSTAAGVYDGPEAPLYEGVVPQEDFVVVGWSGLGDGPVESAVTEQTAISIGNREREETGRIPCLAVAQTGDTEYGTAKAMRDAALALVAGAEAAIRSDPWLGITGLRALVVQFEGVTSLQQLASDDGMACWVEFAVTYTARI
jgi:hypothetical protein